MSESEKRAGVIARACGVVIGLMAAGGTAAFGGTVPVEGSYGGVGGSAAGVEFPEFSGVVPDEGSVGLRDLGEMSGLGGEGGLEELGFAFNVAGRGGNGGSGGGPDSVLGGLTAAPPADWWNGGFSEDGAGVADLSGVSPIGPSGGPSAAPTPLAGLAGAALLAGLGVGRGRGRK